MLGCGLNEPVSEEIFADFFVMVRPDVTDADIERYYERFSFETSVFLDKENCQTSFIRFCSDFPELASQILGLKYRPEFDVAFIESQDSLRELIFFMRKRFTRFMRKAWLLLPENLREPSLHLFNQIRDALLQCDASKAFTYYRRFLQLVDVKLTEKAPFYLVPANVTEEDAKAIISAIKYREMVFSEHFSGVSPASEV
jgi:hypothetical protein